MQVSGSLSTSSVLEELETQVLRLNGIVNLITEVDLKDNHHLTIKVVVTRVSADDWKVINELVEDCEESLRANTNEYWQLDLWPVYN